MKKAVLLINSILIIILELLPYGAVMRFATAPGEILVELYPYFSLLPFGYANFGPLLTALLSVVLLAFTLVFVFVGKARKGITVISVIAFITSLMPLMFGFAYVSFVGVLISVLLLLNIVLSALII